MMGCLQSITPIGSRSAHWQYLLRRSNQRDRQEFETGVPQIEVTPEMIEAGERTLDNKAADRH
jgi:hypothetical protein